MTVPWEEIDKVLAPFDAIPLLVLLEAAIDAPGCGHRISSLSVLWIRAMQRPPSGRRAPTPVDLSELAESVRHAVPVLREVEDTWQLDPRLEVRFPVRGDRLLVHPGQLSNPLATLRTIASLAGAIDAPLVDAHGFGVGDLLDATMHYVDARVSCLRTHWFGSVLPRDEDPEYEELTDRLRRIANAPCVLSEGAWQSSGTFSVADRDWLRSCRSPERAALAWEWATSRAEDLAPTLASDRSLSGGVLALRGRNIERPVPAAIAIASLAEAAARLAAELSDSAWDLVVRHRTAEQGFAMLGAPMDTPDAGETDEAFAERIGAMPTLVSVPGHRRAFVIGCAAGLDVPSLRASIERAEELLGGIGPEEIKERGTSFDDDGSVHRVVVYGGPVMRPPATGPGFVYLHVEELTDIVREAQILDSARVPSDSLIWQFFEETSTLPGVGQLVALSMDDVWRHWITLGVVNDTGVDDLTVLAQSAPDDRHWFRAAQWEPFDVILKASGLPPSWMWPWAKLGDDPGEATVTRRGEEYTIVLDPPLVVIGAFDDDLSSLRLDPTFGIGVADGVRLTIARDEAIADAIRWPDGGPLVVWVRLTAEHLPEPQPDDGGIEVMTDDLPRPSVGLVCSRTWLDELAKDPAAAHRLLGGRLLSGIGALRALPSDLATAFTTAWDATPPVGLLRPYSASLLPRHLGKSNLLPRTLASRGCARRRFHAALVERCVEPGVYEGRDAGVLCRDALLPAMQDALDRLLEPWSPNALDEVARAANDVHAERIRAQVELEGALAAPWADRWQAVALDQDDALHLTKPVDILLESLVANRPGGAMKPDPFDVAEAVDLVDQLIDLASAGAGSAAHLHGLVVAVDDDGTVEVLTGPTDPTTSQVAINVPAYRRAERKHLLRRREAAEQPEGGAEWLERAARRDHEPAPFVSIADFGAPGSLLNADRVLQEVCGTGIDALSAVFATAVSWDSDDDSPYVVEPSELVKQTVVWSQLPEEQVNAAVSRLTLTRDGLHDHKNRLWDDGVQRPRFSARPLIELNNDELLVLPWRVRATQEFYAASLLDGRLPWPARDQTERVRLAFLEYRKRPNRELELVAEATARDLGLACRSNIEPHHVGAAGLVLGGEIDLLAADASRARIWVCEVKDPTTGMSQSALATRLARFVRRGGYVDKLLRSAEAVAASRAGALALLGIEGSSLDWRVVPLMVTRTVEPAGFVEEPRVRYVTIADLGDLFQSPDDPPTGYVEV